MQERLKTQINDCQQQVMEEFIRKFIYKCQHPFLHILQTYLDQVREEEDAVNNEVSSLAQSQQGKYNTFSLSEVIFFACNRFSMGNKHFYLMNFNMDESITQQQLRSMIKSSDLVYSYRLKIPSAVGNWLASDKEKFFILHALFQVFSYVISMTLEKFADSAKYRNSFVSWKFSNNSTTRNDDGKPLVYDRSFSYASVEELASMDRGQRMSQIGGRMFCKGRIQELFDEAVASIFLFTKDPQSLWKPSTTTSTASGKVWNFDQAQSVYLSLNSTGGMEVSDLLSVFKFRGNCAIPIAMRKFTFYSPRLLHKHNTHFGVHSTNISSNYLREITRRRAESYFDQSALHLTLPWLYKYLFALLVKSYHQLDDRLVNYLPQEVITHFAEELYRRKRMKDRSGALRYLQTALLGVHLQQLSRLRSAESGTDADDHLLMNDLLQTIVRQMSGVPSRYSEILQHANLHSNTCAGNARSVLVDTRLLVRSHFQAFYARAGQSEIKSRHDRIALRSGAQKRRRRDSELRREKKRHRPETGFSRKMEMLQSGMIGSFSPFLDRISPVDAFSLQNGGRDIEALNSVAQRKIRLAALLAQSNILDRRRLDEQLTNAFLAEKFALTSLEYNYAQLNAVLPEYYSSEEVEVHAIDNAEGDASEVRDDVEVEDDVEAEESVVRRSRERLQFSKEFLHELSEGRLVFRRWFPLIFPKNLQIRDPKRLGLGRYARKHALTCAYDHTQKLAVILANRESLLSRQDLASPAHRLSIIERNLWQFHGESGKPASRRRLRRSDRTAQNLIFDTYNDATPGTDMAAVNLYHAHPLPAIIGPAPARQLELTRPARKRVVSSAESNSEPNKRLRSTTSTSTSTSMTNSTAGVEVVNLSRRRSKRVAEENTRLNRLKARIEKSRPDESDGAGDDRRTVLARRDVESADAACMDAELPSVELLSHVRDLAALKISTLQLNNSNNAVMSADGYDRPAAGEDGQEQGWEEEEEEEFSSVGGVSRVSRGSVTSTTRRRLHRGHREGVGDARTTHIFAEKFTTSALVALGILIEEVQREMLLQCKQTRRPLTLDMQNIKAAIYALMNGAVNPHLISEELLYNRLESMFAEDLTEFIPFICAVRSEILQSESTLMNIDQSNYLPPRCYQEQYLNSTPAEHPQPQPPRLRVTSEKQVLAESEGMDVEVEAGGRRTELDLQELHGGDGRFALHTVNHDSQYLERQRAIHSTSGFFSDIAGHRADFSHAPPCIGDFLAGQRENSSRIKRAHRDIFH